MKLGLPISVVLHVAFIGGTALHWGSETPIRDELRIIPVEIVNVSDMTTAPRPAPVPTPKPDVPEPAEDIQPVTEETPEERVEVTPDTPPQDAETEPSTETVTETITDTEPPTEMVSETVTQTEPEGVTSQVDETETAQNTDKPSSLDDLFGMTETTTRDYAEQGSSAGTQTQSEINRQQMELAAREGELSTSYEDAVMRRIYNQWQIPAGAPDMESLVVTVLVELSSDGRVTSSRLSGDSASKASKDSFYNSAANSALRAVNKAETFEFLPYDQYVNWQSMTLTFYPKNAPSSVPT